MWSASRRFRKLTSQVIVDLVPAVLLPNFRNQTSIRTIITKIIFNVNFDCRNLVFQLLHHDNENILSVGCSAHILHNSVKHELSKINFDLENFILKLHNHFLYYAKRVYFLKDFYVIDEAEFAPVLRHVKTKWLSLLPTVKRATKSFDILKDYFKSLGEDECPSLLWQVFNFDETETVWNFIKMQ